MFIMCMSSTHGGQKTISDVKELELQKAVNRHMDAGPFLTAGPFLYPVLSSF